MHTPKRNVDLDEPVVGQKKTGIIHWVSDKIKSHGDIYGESVIGPGLYEKSWTGVFVSTVMRIVVLAIIGYYSYLLISGQRENQTGGNTVLNYNLANSDEEYMDLPVAQLRLHNEILYFESDSTSLQGMKIMDMNSFEKTFRSVNSNLPITTASMGSAVLSALNPKLTASYTGIQFPQFNSRRLGNNYRTSNQISNAPSVAYDSHFLLVARFTGVPACSIFLSGMSTNLAEKYPSTWLPGMPYFDMLKVSSDSEFSKDASLAMFYQVDGVANTPSYPICDSSKLVPGDAKDLQRVAKFFGKAPTKVYAPKVGSDYILLQFSGSPTNPPCTDDVSFLLSRNGLDEVLNFEDVRLGRGERKFCLSEKATKYSAAGSYYLKVPFYGSIKQALVSNSDYQVDQILSATEPVWDKFSTPMGWTCGFSAWSDDICDCDCGVPDPACSRSMKFFYTDPDKYFAQTSFDLVQSGKLCATDGTSFDPPEATLSGGCYTLYVTGAVAGNLVSTWAESDQIRFCPAITVDDVNEKINAKFSTAGTKDYTESFQELPVTYASFFVPQRATWNAGTYDINPTTVVPVTPPTKDYSVDDTRVHRIMNYELNDFSLSHDCPVTDKQDYFFCGNVSSPTKKLSYDHVTQMNDKWKFSKGDPDTRDSLKPVRNLRFQHKYLFMHDQSVEDLALKFADSVETTLKTQYGNYLTDQQGNRWYDFSGKQFYSGMQASGNSKYSGMAANNPLLDTTLIFEISDLVPTSDYKKLFKKAHKFYKGTWAKVKHADSIWTDLTVKFDLSSLGGVFDDKITLEPGYKYTLEASIAIEAVYSKGWVDNSHILSSQFQVLSTKVSKSVGPSSESNVCTVEYSITVEDSKRVIRAITFNIFDFLTSVGGALGLLAFGSTALDILQNLFPSKSILAMVEERDRELESKPGLWQKIKLKFSKPVRVSSSTEELM